MIRMEEFVRKISGMRQNTNMIPKGPTLRMRVTLQAISKWETGAAYPDISVLPQLSSYFGVSVDVLLGLVSLEQEYHPSNSGTVEYWENRLEYLKRSRRAMWNEDYMRFLVREVWKIDVPITVLDFGCGYGALGLLIMPLIPAGSKYVGVDFSQTMITAAKDTFAHSGIDAKFIISNILEYKSNEKYDMVISQAVLRHVDDGECFLRKMAGHVKDGGILVSLECNREFEADGLYVCGLDYFSLCQHDGLKKLWRTELEKQNRDYSIAMKIPHYMKNAGLKNVSCRMNDRVTFLEPGQPDYRELLENCVRADNWDDGRTDSEIEKDVMYFMNHGMNRKEAEDYCRQQNGIVKYLKDHAGEVALTKVTGIMISYGWK